MKKLRQRTKDSQNPGQFHVNKLATVLHTSEDQLASLTEQEKKKKKRSKRQRRSEFVWNDNSRDGELNKSPRTKTEFVKMHF